MIGRPPGFAGFVGFYWIFWFPLVFFGAFFAINYSNGYELSTVKRKHHSRYNVFNYKQIQKNSYNCFSLS